jgi:chemotaxis protein methyltransferase CheR
MKTEELAAAVRARHGIDPLASVAIRARFELAIKELGADIDGIAARLRVGETRFYRDGAQLESVVGLLRGERVRVLSAGCSTGEEVYTVAMLLELANIAAFEVAGVDALVDSVTTARSARYPATALSTVPPRLRRFFTERGPEVEIAPAIVAHCRFNVGDLLTTPLFGPFDAILCRNVLIYLDDDVALKLLERLANALAPNGVLCVARAEVAIARRVPGLLATTLPGDVVVFGRQRRDSIKPEPIEELGPPSRVRLIVRREDRPDDITARGLELLGTGSAVVELTIVGSCDEARIAELATPLRRLSSAARTLGAELRATDAGTARLLRSIG